MMQEPATVFVYWETDRATDGWEATSVAGQSEVAHRFRTGGAGRRGYLRVAPGRIGYLLLQPVEHDEAGPPVAAVGVHPPRAAGSSAPQGRERWLRVSPAPPPPPEPIPAPAAARPAPAPASPEVAPPPAAAAAPEPPPAPPPPARPQVRRAAAPVALPPRASSPYPMPGQRPRS